MAVYYNDNDPFVCEWLRNLIREGLIADGDVDCRPIQEVEPTDLDVYDQAHFFAGIGGWSYALRLAGWPNDEPVWTGSCPCQPFSVAGKKRGEKDERHLWPEWHRLIAECRPPVVFGEQVASPAGRRWLSSVRLQMEALGYGVGGADLCAAGIGAPHIRQRLWFVADAVSAGWTEGRTRTREGSSSGGSGSSELGHPSSQGGGRHGGAVLREEAASEGERSAARNLADKPVPSSEPRCLANPINRRREESDLSVRSARQGQATALERGASFWGSTDWIPCADGKARPVEPGTFPLAHGVPARVGRLRAYGNAIVPQLAAEFVRAYLECRS